MTHILSRSACGLRALFLSACLLGGCSALVVSPPPSSGGAAACRAASLTNPATLVPGGTAASTSPQVAGLPGGLGGTGRPAKSAPAQEGGIGGTGVVGVVTGFASICVNGLEVEFDQSTPFQRDGQRAQARDLLVGQVVALQAVGQGDRLRATQIALLDAVVGPVSRVDAGTGRLSLMGQDVVSLSPADLEGLAPGDWVRVSGHRLANGEIRATRVQRAEAGEGQVTGAVSLQGTGGLRVGNTVIGRGSARWPTALADGQEVSVRGRWTGARLEARDVQINPTRAAMGGVQEVVLQGYVHRLRGNELQLGYESLKLGDRLRVQGGRLDQLREGQAVQVRGRLDRDRNFTADRLTFRNEDGRGRGGDDRSGRRGRGGSGDDDDDDDDSDRSDSGKDSDHSDSGKDSDHSGSGSDDSGKSGGRDSDSSGSGSSGSGSSGSGSGGSGSSGSGSSGSGK